MEGEEEDGRRELIEYFCGLGFVYETSDGPSGKQQATNIGEREQQEDQLFSPPVCVCVCVRACVRGDPVGFSVCRAVRSLSICWRDGTPSGWLCVVLVALSFLLRCGLRVADEVPLLQLRQRYRDGELPGETLIWTGETDRQTDRQTLYLRCVQGPSQLSDASASLV